MSERHYILGTRASPLALTQSKMVAAALRSAHDWADPRVTLQTIITKGDRQLDRKLADIGGKGLFTEELERGLRDASLDLAVHSLKDLPTDLPDGLVLGAILPRANAHDVLVPRPGLALGSLADLPHGGHIGTASLRRQAQILHARPDLKVSPLRGNVGTRLQKLAVGDFDAIVLAAAGLQRLGLTPNGPDDPNGSVVLAAENMLPAAGQGALAVQCRTDDAQMRTALAVLHCADTADCVAAERAFLAALDGSCRTPIAALATLHNGRLTLRGRILSDDGKQCTDASMGISMGVSRDISIDAATEGATDRMRALAVDLGRRLADKVRS